MATVIVLDPCSSPDFYNPIALAPNGSEGVGLWSVDRYEPEIFESPATAPDGTINTLHHGIDAADGQAAGFYNTQGRRYALHPSSIETEIELYVPADWATTGRRMAGLWGKLLMQQMPYPVIRSLSLLPMEVPRDLEDMKGWFLVRYGLASWFCL